jgi:hypothetical protein
MTGPAADAPRASGREWTRRRTAALFDGVDGSGLAAFVAALRRARGEDATADGDRVATGDGPDLVAHAPPRWLPVGAAVAGVDPPTGAAVVTPSPAVADRLRARGVAVVGPATLRDRLLYGLERPAAEALCREHLGRSLADGPPRRPVDRLRAVLAGPAGAAAVAVAVLVLVAAVVAGAGAGGGADGRPDGAATAAPRTAAPLESTPVDRVEEVGAPPVAPGLTTEGVANRSALTAAHAAALEGRSYQWLLVYRAGMTGSNPVLGRNNVSERLTTALVENGSRSLVRASGDADGPVRVLPFGARAVYTDGRERAVRSAVVREPPTVSRDRVAPGAAGWPADAAARVVDWALRGRESDVVAAETEDGRTVYRLVATGPGVRVEADVTDAGLVTELVVVRGSPDGTRSVLRFRYVGFDDTTVEAPAWAGEEPERTTATPTPATGPG